MCINAVAKSQHLWPPVSQLSVHRKRAKTNYEPNMHGDLGLEGLDGQKFQVASFGSL